MCQCNLSPSYFSLFATQIIAWYFHFSTVQHFKLRRSWFKCHLVKCYMKITTCYTCLLLCYLLHVTNETLFFIQAKRKIRCFTMGVLEVCYMKVVFVHDFVLSFYTKCEQSSIITLIFAKTLYRSEPRVAIIDWKLS